jgi:uroporphyrinogen decarboxylase
MTPKERVRAVLAGKEPDRVPIVLGASNATGIKMRTYEALCRLNGIEEDIQALYEFPELGTAKTSEAMFQVLHTDVRPVFDRMPASVLKRNAERPPHSDFIDDWGSGNYEVKEGEWFPGIHPLNEATAPVDLEAYDHWPNMDDATRYAHVAAEAAELAKENQYAVMATPWLMFPLERAFAMQGMDSFLLNMSLYPDLAKALLRKTLDLCKTNMDHFLKELGPNVDIIKIGDDLGTQESLLFSPDMYREFLKPLHAEYIEFIKARTGAKVFFHTDGDVFDLIPDFIEIGVDILNPIQTSAGRMSDLEKLKNNFGDKLVFCGAIDTQHVLPHGTPDEVKKEVHRVISILGEGGGYMLSSVHTIMNEVPAENVMAMVEATLEASA